MTPEDDDPDDLARDYRRASAEDAGRPAAATRAAILAEARALAERRRDLPRQPAANDGAIWWRAAASVAVVGVGLLIWRQVDRPVAPLAPAKVARADTGNAGDTVSAEAEVVATDTAAAETRVANTELRARSQAQDAPALAKARLPAAPAPPASPAAPGSAAGAIASAATAAATEKLQRRAENASAAQAPVDAAELMRRQFPAEYANSAPPRALWVLQDESGAVVRSGRLDDNEQFAAATERLQTEFTPQRIGPWSVTPVVNAQGVAVQIGVAVVR